MPFTVQCSSCRSRFALPDAVFTSRIAGKIMDLPCKHCKELIRVDGTKPDALPSTSSDEISALERAHQEAMLKRAASRAPVAMSFSETDLPSVREPVEGAESASSGEFTDGDGRPVRTGETQGGFPSVLPGLGGGSPSGATRVVVGRIGKGSTKMRVPLPGGMKPKPSRTPSGVLSPSTSSESKASSDDDFDLPTEVIPRPSPAVAKRTGRSASTFKATMMGVAPPPSPTKLGGSSLSSASQSLETPAVGTGDSAQLARAKTAAGPGKAPPRPNRLGDEKLPRGRNKLAQGTMLGLAPAPPHSGELEAVRLDALEESSESRQDPAARADRGAERVSEGIPRESATDLSMELEDDDSFGEAEPAVLGETSDIAAFSDDDETRVETPFAALGEQNEPTSAPGEGWAGSHGEVVHAGASMTTHGEAAHSAVGEDAVDWDGADSDVSRQISQSLPRRESRPRKGRWLLAALVSVVGGAAVVGLLVVQGHVSLPPQVHAQLAELAPSLAERVSASSRADVSASAAAQANAVEPVVRPSQPATEVLKEPEAAQPANPIEPAAEPARAPVAVAAAAAKAVDAVADERRAKPAPDDKPQASDRGEAEESGSVSDDPLLASAIDTLPDGVRLGTVQDRLYRAKKRAEKCHLSGRAVGDAEVVVTFAPNGRVQSTVVKGEPIASAPVAACIRANMDAVLIPEFDGKPFVVSQAITLD